MKAIRTLSIVVIVCAGSVPAAHGQIRISSPLNKHNLSATGPGPVKSATMTETCVFCHTPHNASPAVPLWNQELPSGVTYTPYGSTTMAAAPGVPTGSSKLCLSCHDGTVAIGKSISNGQIPMQGVNAQGRLTGASVLGTNLRDDHPISFVPVTGPQIVNPPAGGAVRLDAAGQLQCRSCHEPHQMDIDTTTRKFLVMNNSASAMCLVCHQKTYWSTAPSTHKTSTKAYAAAQGAHTGYSTVATNGCESCHKPHTAITAARTLKAQEEATCGTGTGSQCHGNNAIGRNIATEFTKTYRHPTYSTTPSVHDASESPTNPTYRLPETSAAASRHAECPDCHNGHASYAGTASAPKGSGKLAGVWGIDTNGNLVQPSGTPASVREYEICYKCHAGSANKPQVTGQPNGPYPTRVIQQFDMRLMFDPANPSFHSIEAGRPTLTLPSLISPWTASSVMYCTDCHSSDTGPKAAPTPGTGPSGPHGSNQKQLLAGRYDRDASLITETAATYALCYKCHSRTSILGDASFKEHNKHIVGEQSSCSICHDPHGVSSTQGNAINNAHLINFDKRYVTPASGGILRYESTGTRTGRCYLTCHGKNHNPISYKP